MGSEGKVLDVIYDTGSDWLVLDTDFCDNCLTQCMILDLLQITKESQEIL